MPLSEHLEPICWICNKHVNLETAKTDERGRAVHEQCYVLTHMLKNTTQPTSRARKDQTHPEQ